jgi:hypothetical protein
MRLQGRFRVTLSSGDDVHASARDQQAQPLPQQAPQHAAAGRSQLMDLLVAKLHRAAVTAHATGQIEHQGALASIATAREACDVSRSSCDSSSSFGSSYSHLSALSSSVGCCAGTPSSCSSSASACTSLASSTGAGGSRARQVVRFSEPDAARSPAAGSASAPCTPFEGGRGRAQAAAPARSYQRGRFSVQESLGPAPIMPWYRVGRRPSSYCGSGPCDARSGGSSACADRPATSMQLQRSCSAPDVLPWGELPTSPLRVAAAGHQAHPAPALDTLWEPLDSSEEAQELPAAAACSPAAPAVSAAPAATPTPATSTPGPRAAAQVSLARRGRFLVSTTVQ